MTRKEQIQKKAARFTAVTGDFGYTEDIEDAFTQGAKWADTYWENEFSKFDLTSHGRLYSIWLGMKSRCNNKNNISYSTYGGKGITVCKEWDRFFINFAIWSLFHGYDDSLTIDRINNDRDYEPSNCRWSDYKEQGNNTSRNHFIGDKTIAQHADHAGMNYRTMHNRLTRGTMSITEALNAVPYNPKKVYQYDKNGNFIAEYPSARIACEQISGKRGARSHIDDVCRGRRKFALGYKWSSYIKIDK